MKHFLTTAFLLVATYGYTQSQGEKIQFTYDNSGNQIVRQLICISCKDPGGRPANPFSDEDLIESTEHQKISYYPNPVLEQLYIKWYNDENKFVKSVSVYSMSGQLVSSKQNLGEKDNTTVDFLNLPTGTYSVVLFYSNDEKKDLKVIKK